MTKEQCNYCSPDIYYFERKPLINGCIFVKIKYFNGCSNVLCENPHPLSGEEDSVKFNFCPMCGRKLKTE